MFKKNNISIRTHEAHTIDSSIEILNSSRTFLINIVIDSFNKLNNNLYNIYLSWKIKYKINADSTKCKQFHKIFNI